VVAARAGADQVVAQVDSGQDGTFVVDVPAGSYLVRAQSSSGAPMPSAPPVPVVVEPGRRAVVDVRLDSGVR
jgi:hypothetical protein